MLDFPALFSPTRTIGVCCGNAIFDGCLDRSVVTDPKRLDPTQDTPLALSTYAPTCSDEDETAKPTFQLLLPTRVLWVVRAPSWEPEFSSF